MSWEQGLPRRSSLFSAEVPCPEHILSPLLVIQEFFCYFSLATMCFHKCPKDARICYFLPIDLRFLFHMKDRRKNPVRALWYFVQWLLSPVPRNGQPGMFLSALICLQSFMWADVRFIKKKKKSYEWGANALHVCVSQWCRIFLLDLWQFVTF